MPTDTLQQRPTPETPAKAITLATWPTIATKLAAVVPSLRFKMNPADQKFMRDGVALQVTDADTCATAGTVLVAVKRFRRAAEVHYETIKRPFNGLLGAIRDCERADVGPLTQAETTLDGRIIGWRREEQARERERLAEEQREADLRAKARRDAEVAAMQRVADATAEPLLRATLGAEAQALAEAPLAVETVAVETDIPVVPGLSFTKRYKGELRGDAALLAFVKAIGQKKIPLQGSLGLKEIKGHTKVYESPYLNDQVRSHQGELGWPGVTVVEDEGTTGR